MVIEPRLPIARNSDQFYPILADIPIEMSVSRCWHGPKTGFSCPASWIFNARASSGKTLHRSLPGAGCYHFASPANRQTAAISIDCHDRFA
jgi:hypothetical protein